jgi:hypothetical protein
MLRLLAPIPDDREWVIQEFEFLDLLTALKDTREVTNFNLTENPAYVSVSVKHGFRSPIQNGRRGSGSKSLALVGRGI